ncbi:unnamed protein product [Heligmosomoides polygyrus]|uniref:BACK domain-containing protein n=1 Tax=Heligmosomoides polygyrus TaxID=6339 RepID=A0A183GDS7_HELPZ|nr:unnamed protein product [Heligmosomoides polygyrus]
MLKRDSFFAVEIDIFHAMCKWIQAQPLMEATPLEMLIKSLVSKNCLRLHLMSTKELLTTVRHSALFDTNSPTLDAFILDAIDWKMQYSKLSNFRGALLADENVVTVKLGAVVVAGVNTEKLLSREAHNSGGGSALTRHKIGTKEGIVVKLGQPYTINTIVLQQPDWQVGSAYSCFIEASMDRRDWVNVAHHVDYQCTSFQTLIFDARLVRFIRIVGSHNLEKHKHFSLVSFEALYSTKNAKMLNGTSLVVTESGHCHVKNHAAVTTRLHSPRLGLVSDAACLLRSDVAQKRTDASNFLEGRSRAGEPIDRRAGFDSVVTQTSCQHKFTAVSKCSIAPFSKNLSGYFDGLTRRRRRCSWL